MSKAWKHSRLNRWYLPVYLTLQTVALLGVLWFLKGFDAPSIAITPFRALGLALLGLYLGMKLPTIMHNCMHGNLRWANDLVGEMTAFLILMSFSVVNLLHTLHHAYPDTEMDPHNPDGISFWKMVFTSQFRGARVLERKYLELHGPTLFNSVLYRFSFGLHLLGNGLRLVFFYVVLGNLFYWFYLPAFISYLFIFAHTNYVTHARAEDGTPIVLNLNSNVYYRVMNILCDGIYFHENHHRYPKAYNPQTVRVKV